MTQRRVMVEGAFDDLRSRQIRFLEEAARWGRLTVLLRSDERIGREQGRPPKFPRKEREYFLRSLRFVSEVAVLGRPPAAEDLGAGGESPPGLWIAEEPQPEWAEVCARRGWAHQVVPAAELERFPEPPPLTAEQDSRTRRVVVTGCYDWFHSGHIRFFEEASALGDLYVVVGHDTNIRLLKGPGHPLFSQSERRYLAGSIRYVKHALISSGDGWLDADPEIQRIRPHLYVVNEDGDKGGKREYCQERGIEYRVLRRLPAPGLPGRTSTNLRGF